MVKAVFFDWFNTLACYEPPREEIHSQLLSEFGIKVSPAELLPGLLAADRYFYTEQARSPVNKRNPEEKAEVYLHYADIMLSRAGVKADKELIQQILKKWEHAFKGITFTLFDDVLSTLDALKQRNLVLGLLTNATKDTISVHRKLGLEPYLDFVVTSEEAGADKPEPLIFLAALNRAGANASETVHVGDQYELDVVGARRVGITPVLVDRYNAYPEISDCLRIQSLTELAENL